MSRIFVILFVIMVSLSLSLSIKLINVREDLSYLFHEIAIASSGLSLAEATLLKEDFKNQPSKFYDDKFLPKGRDYQYTTSIGFSVKEIRLINRIYRELFSGSNPSKSYGFITESGNYLSMDPYSSQDVPTDNIDFCVTFSICPNEVDSLIGFGMSDIYHSSTNSFDKTLMLYTSYRYFNDGTGVSLAKKIRLDHDYLPIGSKVKIYMAQRDRINIDVKYDGFLSVELGGFVRSGEQSIEYLYSVPLYVFFGLYDLMFYLTFLFIILSLLIQARRAQKLTVKYSETLNMAIYDELTGLENANSLSLFQSETHVKPYTVVFIDGNGIKQINDQLGHRAGNESIVAIADALRTSVRDSDRVFRYGGDEFVLCLDCIDERVVSDIIARIHRNVLILGRSSVSVSVGVSYSTESISFEESLKLADKRMYEHKTVISSSNYI